MATVFQAGRKVFGASALALTLFSGAAFAQASFPAPAAEFEGMVRAGSAQPGAPVIAGDTVSVEGQGFVPGQAVTLQRGTQVLNADGPIVADAEGKFAASFTLPADAATGLHPIVVIAENPSVAQVVELKVSPVVPLSGAEKFDITSAPLVRGLYQSAYSAKNDALFVTSAVGRPPVKEAALLRVDPATLEIVAQVTPAAAPALPDGREAGVFAVYGVGVDDAHGTVWVTNTRQNTVSVYNQDDLSLVKQFEPGVVSHARDVVIDAGRNRAYVSAARSDALEVFDAETLEKVATVKVPSAKRGEEFFLMSLAIDEARGLLYTVSMTSGEAAVIDLNTNEVVKVLPLKGAISAAGVAVDAETGRLFVASQQSDNLLIVDLETGAVLHDVAVGAGPLNVAFDPVSRLAFVANRGAGTVTVVDPDGVIVANLDGGSLPNHVIADGLGNIFSVNKARGENDPQGDRITRIAPAN